MLKFKVVGQFSWTFSLQGQFCISSLVKLLFRICFNFFFLFFFEVGQLFLILSFFFKTFIFI